MTAFHLSTRDSMEEKTLPGAPARRKAMGTHSEVVGDCIHTTGQCEKGSWRLPAPAIPPLKRRSLDSSWARNCAPLSFSRLPLATLSQPWTSLSAARIPRRRTSTVVEHKLARYAPPPFPPHPPPTTTLDTRQSTLDARHSTLDTRHSTLDTRHSTLDTRHYSTLKHTHTHTHTHTQALKHSNTQTLNTRHSTLNTDQHGRIRSVTPIQGRSGGVRVDPQVQHNVQIPFGWTGYTG